MSQQWAEETHYRSKTKKRKGEKQFRSEESSVTPGWPTTFSVCVVFFFFYIFRQYQFTAASMHSSSFREQASLVQDPYEDTLS